MSTTPSTAPPEAVPTTRATISVADLRTELGLTLAEMGERVGLSKSQMHDVERRNSATVRVSLMLESMSDGRLDAGVLCEEVWLSRHGLPDTDKAEATPTGQCGPLSGETGAVA
ncbi:helix-turn-helix transcriptional regulator [Novosphingobium olei]|uniref:helix-turn-helix domain-containing protein n=1 Tax=Novosphingobium olei TaxID=2728851 RepID=UPI00308BC241|nr:hypothetical protein NSDW_33190 [Novosphingobium olei]